MANWNLYESRLNKNGNNIRDRQINYMKDGIINSFKNTPSFREVYFNNETTITEVQITDTLDYNVKTVLIKPDESIFIGDMLYFDNDNWLCTKIDFTNPAYELGTVQKCNNTINLYRNNILYKIPIVVESGARLFQMGTEGNKFLTTPATLIIVRMPFNEITMGIKRGVVYKIGVQNWKVEDVNDIIEQGLLIVRMEYSQESQEEYNYNLIILNGDNIQISQSQSLIINAQLTKNDIIVPSPSLIYTSNDESIATIDNNGLVAALDIGSVVFKVSLKSDESVVASIGVDIITDEIDNLTVEIRGANSIVKGYTSNYSCVFKNNGNIIPMQSEFYLTSDDGTSPTNLAEIISQDSENNTCTVKGLNLGYVKLWSKSIDGNIVSDPLRIQIKNLF